MSAWLCLISQVVGNGGTVFVDNLFAGASRSSAVCCAIRFADILVCGKCTAGTGVPGKAVVI